MFFTSKGSTTDHIGLVAIMMVCQGDTQLKSSLALDLGSWKSSSLVCEGGFSKGGAKLFPTSQNTRLDMVVTKMLNIF